jgi:hypothetical protein
MLHHNSAIFFLFFRFFLQLLRLAESIKNNVETGGSP